MYDSLHKCHELIRASVTVLLKIAFPQWGVGRGGTSDQYYRLEMWAPYIHKNKRK